MVFSGLVMLWRLAGWPRQILAPTVEATTHRPVRAALAIVGEGDHRRRGTTALGIFDHLGLVSFHHSNARVGGSEIDANCLRHDQAPCLEMRVDRLLSGAHRHVGRMNRASLRTFFDRMRDAQSASGGETANASRDRSEDLKRLP